MAKFTKTIRNNWKKSLLGTVAVIYGINYAHDKYKVQQLMRTYCEEAEKYGDVQVPHTLRPRNITVILNPAANKRKAKSNFEKYCAPLLHLAGYSVDILQTESEGQARSLAAGISDTDVIVVAGGDGTVSETVTGLMRAHGGVRNPLGVLPLGRTNSVACSLLGLNKEGVVSPAHMAAAAMAIVRGNTKPIDAIRVDVIQDEENLPKPVFGLSGIRWGAYRDALSKQDRYWYLGILRGYAAVLFHMWQPTLVTAHVTFTHACNGCRKCYNARTDLHPIRDKRWYHYFMPKFSSKASDTPSKNYREVVNEECGLVSAMHLTGVDINISCPCIHQKSEGIVVTMGPTNLSWLEYMREGWRRVRGEPPDVLFELKAQELEIIPTLKENEESWFSIDNEDYEVRPVKVTLLPNSVQVFLPQPPQT